MKLIDAIKRVDRTQQSFDPDYGNFCNELGINDYSGWNEKFSERMKVYYLIKWCCTDTWVGLAVYFLDDEPVAISWQPARKSDTDYEFVSEEAAKKVRDFILSIMEQDDPTFKLMDIDKEIEETYSISFTNRLLGYEGFVDGRPCKVVREKKEEYISQKVTVKFEDGTEKRVNIKDFMIPIAIVKEDKTD